MHCPSASSFWATVCKAVSPLLSDRCLSGLTCPVLSVTLVYCGQPVGQIKMKHGTPVGLGPGHIVLHGDPAPLLQRGRSPQFSAHICCSQMAGWIKMSLGIEVGLDPGDFVLDGNPAPLPKMAAKPVPQFSAHVYCGQTAGCIKMVLGIEYRPQLRVSE